MKNIIILIVLFTFQFSFADSKKSFKLPDDLASAFRELFVMNHTDFVDPNGYVRLSFLCKEMNFCEIKIEQEYGINMNTLDKIALALGYKLGKVKRTSYDYRKDGFEDMGEKVRITADKDLDMKKLRLQVVTEVLHLDPSVLDRLEEEITQEVSE